MTNVGTRTTSSTPTWRLWVAPLVWAVHFLAIYGFTALACAREGSGTWFGVATLPWFVGAATIVAAAVLLLGIGAAVREGRRGAALPDRSRFVAWLTAALGSLVLLAVLWETLPILIVPVCA